MSALTRPIPDIGPQTSDFGPTLRRPGGIRASAAKYAAVFATCLRNQLAYAGEWALRGVFLAMVLFIFLQLWRATYQGRSTIAGFTIAQMIWYLALTESIVLSRTRIGQTIDREVRTGDVAYTLVRPYSYAGYYLASYLGERLPRFATTLAIGAALALLYVGPVPLQPWAAVAALVTLLVAMCIDFIGSFGIGLLAFWTEDTASINLIYDRLVMLLGGMMLPLAAFPKVIGDVARVLPFGVMVYGPAGLALGAPDASFGRLSAQQAAWMLVAGAIVWLVYRAALRRITANGG
jgi:ABC-2 type transport system permease protein